MERELNPPERNEIRVLLLHHSATWLGRTLRINPTCRQLLDEFLVRHGFSVLLCGHTHMARIERLSLEHLGGQSISPLHACCGSSSRITTLPTRLTLVGRRIPRPTWVANSLLLHELRAEEGGLRWGVQTYFETPHGFKVPRLNLATTTGSLFFKCEEGNPD